MPKGKLLVVGTGIAGVAHLTLQTVSAIETSDVVYFLVADHITIGWILKIRPDAKSLYHHYSDNTDRVQSYAAMANEIVDSVRIGKTVVAAFYGHPGIFVSPSRIAISLAKKEGYDTRMLPGISADQCLIADLGVDPGSDGWQMIEATQFLICDKRVDVTSPVVFWQVGVIGDTNFSRGNTNPKALEAFKAKLLALYPEEHRICIYEAAEYVVLSPKIKWITLQQLNETLLSAISTLFVPKVRDAIVEEKGRDLLI